MKQQEAIFQISSMRIGKIDFEFTEKKSVEKPSIKTNIELLSKVSIRHRAVENIIKLSVVAETSEGILFKLDLTHFASFVCTSENAQKEIYENFSKYNAPSIVYPSIRTAVATVTVASGIPSVLLPLMNFMNYPSKVEFLD